ncbi:cation:proton antiporter [Streptomyces sp. NPDC057674]|uniref:cation:proton antiporter domain-containing protein n=1 Tax=Streptomyces sp. NPDC057674 TaxID=3346203 RepID=UPI0036C9F461
MHSAVFLIEFGAIILGLGLLGRLAGRFSFSPIPLYLLAGLAFGKGGLLPLGTSEEFVAIGAEIGVILLLLMLGLEYTASDLVSNLKTQYPAGLVDFALNALPVVTALTKIATGHWAARRAGIGVKGRWRAGGTLVARGEFSIVIAGLAVTAGVQPQLGPFATAYVLILVVIGPLTARYTEPIAGYLLRGRRKPTPSDEMTVREQRTGPEPVRVPEPGSTSDRV